MGLILAGLVSFVSLRKISQAQSSIPKLEDLIKVSTVEGKQVVDMREDLTLLIDAFGSRMAKSLRMSFLQGMGASAKIDKGLKGAMAQDIIEEKMPLLNLAADFMGFNTKQYISKHPEALGQILQMAGPMLQGKNFDLKSLISGNAGIGQPSNNGEGVYG